MPEQICPLDLAPRSEASESEPRRPVRARRARWALGLASGLLLLYGVMAATLFVWPLSDRLQPVGAVLSLNGNDEGARTQLAVSIVEKGFSHVLLFSQGSEQTPCPAVPEVEVVCFKADPGRTVGEINFANQYARQHGIHSVLIVAGHAQATRARLLAHRCFSGRSLIVAATMPGWQYPYEIAYETGALLKATLVARGCS